MKNLARLLIMSVMLLVCGLGLAACTQISALKITFMVDDVVYHMAEANLDGSINFPQEPTKPDLYFIGWYSDGLTKFSFGDTVTSSITLHARFSDSPSDPINALVSFDSNGGTDVQPVHITDGGMFFSYPSNPVKRGCEFGGWFFDNGTFYEAFNIANLAYRTISTGTFITVYAKWDLIGYKVAYDLKGGENNPANPLTYTVESVFSLEDPYKEGYVFTGWTFAGITTPQKNFVIENSTSNLAFTANWSVYQGTAGLSYTLIDKGTAYSVSRGTATDVNVVIPLMRNNLPVTEIAFQGFREWHDLESIKIPSSITTIGATAFTFCTSLTAVTIPNSVTTIGDGAFSHCYGLTEITVPGSVTAIGYNTFAVCTALKTVVIENGVKSIGTWAFSSCIDLISITIPSSMTSIGAWALIHTRSLESIIVDSGNPVYKSEGNCLIRIADSTLIAGFKNSIIPFGVKAIEEYAFYGQIGLKSINLPSSLTSIGFNAFSGCTSLGGTVIIPSGISVINYAAFSSCTSLESVIIPEGLTVIDNSAFAHCPNITSITIPRSVTSIGNESFWYCTNLKVFYGGANLAEWENIDIAMFNNANDWLINAPRYYYSATQPAQGDTFWRFVDDVPTIWQEPVPTPSLDYTLISSGTAYSVSRGTLADADIVIPAMYNGLPVTEIGERGFRDTKITSVFIPYTVTAIGRYAFYGCHNLTSVSFQGGVTVIGDYAFAYCTNLPNIELPLGVTTLGRYAFHQTNSMTSIEIPNGVTSIGDYAFYNSGLTSVIIPNGITVISDFAFAYCGSLTSVTIPNSVTAINRYAFHQCVSLVKAIIPEGVTSLGDCAFYNSGLSEIVIPVSLKTIGHLAFHYCTDLGTVFYGGVNNSQWNAIAMGGDNRLLNGATRYYYSVTQPPASGNFWRFVGGIPVVW